jgi:hypothetical protein
VRSRGLLFSLCDPQRVGENKSRRAWKLRRLVLAPRGLTGLLNPLSIWHKIISVVFHELFQLYFIPSPSVRAISLCSFPCVAKLFACASFVATSILECRFSLAIAACPQPLRASVTAQPRQMLFFGQTCALLDKLSNKQSYALMSTRPSLTTFGIIILPWNRLWLNHPFDVRP